MANKSLGTRQKLMFRGIAGTRSGGRPGLGGARPPVVQGRQQRSVGGVGGVDGAARQTGHTGFPQSRTKAGGA